jgi:hypothetical protein
MMCGHVGINGDLLLLTGKPRIEALLRFNDCD